MKSQHRVSNILPYYISIVDLEHDGFDTSPPLFQLLVAETNDTKTIIGYILYHYSYNTWQGKAIHLEDLYITKKFRKDGKLADRMLKTLAEVALLFISKSYQSFPTKPS